MLAHNSVINSPQDQQAVRLYGTSTYQGLSVTPGVGSKGSWASAGSFSNVATGQVHGIYILISEWNTSGADRQGVLDIGMDTAGGTDYSVIFSNLIGGKAVPNYLGGVAYYFPFYAPSGASFSVRAQSNATNACRVSMHLVMNPANPANGWVGTYSQTIGDGSIPVGVSFTPGTNAKGSWVSLGTTSANLKYFQLGIHAGNATLSNASLLCDLAYGDGTNYTTIIENMVYSATGTVEAVSKPLLPEECCFADVPAGSTLYVRASSAGAPASGFSAIAYGVGG